jgi:uncharacterized membrane protein YkoI
LGAANRANEKRKTKMKIKTLILPAAAMVLLASLAAATLRAQDKSESEPKAKISKKEATKTALRAVPDGQIKEAELEQEKGLLIWSFDLATPDTKDTTEVHVDAKTGRLLSVEKESAKDEAREAKEDSDKKEGSEKKDHVGRKEAARIALSNAPFGKIKGVELEEEDGELVWSFKIVSKVRVNAITGRVAGREEEQEEQSSVRSHDREEDEPKAKGNKEDEDDKKGTESKKEGKKRKKGEKDDDDEKE